MKLRTVLLIDDDIISNTINYYLIDDHTCTEKILTFSDGYEAYKFIIERSDSEFKQIELIIVDLIMPYLSGLEFIEQLKDWVKSRGLVTPKIVLLTASTNQRDRELALSQNITAYMEKPLSNEKIDQILQLMYQEVI